MSVIVSYFLIIFFETACSFMVIALHCDSMGGNGRSACESHGASIDLCLNNLFFLKAMVLKNTSFPRQGYVSGMESKEDYDLRVMITKFCMRLSLTKIQSVWVFHHCIDHDCLLLFLQLLLFLVYPSYLVNYL